METYFMIDRDYDPNMDDEELTPPKILVVAGLDDPEMRQIKKKADSLGIEMIQGQYQGRPIRTGAEAYMADDLPPNKTNYRFVILIEMEIASGQIPDNCLGFARCDHHNPAKHAAARAPPELHNHTSSLGQFIDLVNRLLADYYSPDRAHCLEMYHGDSVVSAVDAYPELALEGKLKGE